MSELAIHVLGAGSAGATELLPSSFVLEQERQPKLLIDCGPGVLGAYKARYGQLPDAVYISHPHMDHVADLEKLFIAACFNDKPAPKIYVPAPLVPRLTDMFDNHPAQLAEGGANFWQVLQLVAVKSGFWLSGLNFRVTPARHHQPDFSFSLSLPGRFFFTADTRPIPEVLHHLAAQGEPIFHDAGLIANPSHSGVEDLKREYDARIWHQLHLYHYTSEKDAAGMAAEGFKVVKAGETFELPVLAQPT
ncbi:MBL fold metallo-hydrolase [Corallincola platygyrae]|uniref:MBL fold metallo-hydrolase n=1 Tax=Corallincola platygyrae TaxID=1193278 RepID=A0ABW4XQ75_9GAMM